MYRPLVRIHKQLHACDGAIVLVPARVGARSPHSLALVRVHGAALVPVLSTLGSIALVLLFTESTDVRQPDFGGK